MRGLHPEIAPRLEVLPNGFDPALLELRDRPREPDERATLVHAGTLYGDRSAVTLMRALARPELASRARLVLVGAIDPPHRGGAAARPRRARGRRRAAGAVARWRSSACSAADIAVVINSPGTGGDMAAPSKLYEALALGTPVLALTEPGSETERLLQAPRPRRRLRAARRRGRDRARGGRGCSTRRRRPSTPPRSRRSTATRWRSGWRRCWIAWRARPEPERARLGAVRQVGASRAIASGRSGRALNVAASTSKSRVTGQERLQQVLLGPVQARTPRAIPAGTRRAGRCRARAPARPARARQHVEHDPVDVAADLDRVRRVDEQHVAALRAPRTPRAARPARARARARPAPAGPGGRQSGTGRRSAARSRALGGVAPAAAAMISVEWPEPSSTIRRGLSAADNAVQQIGADPAVGVVGSAYRRDARSVARAARTRASRPEVSLDPGDLLVEVEVDAHGARCGGPRRRPAARQVRDRAVVGLRDDLKADAAGARRGRP